MWIVLILMGILFVDYALLRASHKKNDTILDDMQQMYMIQGKTKQEEDGTEP